MRSSGVLCAYKGGGFSRVSEIGIEHVFIAYF